VRSAFTVIFAASGAAALIYEVTWTRLLTLQIGHGLAAASTVLAAFMGGLAAGSAVGGRLMAQVPPARALRAYAALELAIGALALALPFELAALSPLLTRAYADGAGGGTFTALRVAASLLLLSLPAFAMGATFPAASRWFIHSAHAAARDAGVLYAANTVGAAAGALLAGFVLLPSLGLSGATWVGVALNAVAALGALQVAAREPAPQDAPGPRTEPDAAKPAAAAGSKRRKGRAGGSHAISETPRVGRPGLAAAALGVSGFASLTLQVVWTRLLALILGPTTYAFSIMVAVFVAGLAIGAAIASRLATRAREPLVGLAVCLALSVGCGAAAAAFVDRGLLAIAGVIARPDVSFSGLLARQALLAAALLAPMTIAFGAAFPFAIAAGTRRDDTITSDVGLIYAVNTAGAIAGALAAGFVLIPSIGLHGTIRAVTLIGAVAAAALLVLGNAAARARAAAGVVVALVAGLGIALPEWDRLLLSRTPA
jgi:spermidine synthase